MYVCEFVCVCPRLAMCACMLCVCMCVCSCVCSCVPPCVHPCVCFGLDMRVVCRWLKNRSYRLRFSEPVCLSSPPALCHYSILILRVAVGRAKRESASVLGEGWEEE